MLSRFIQTISIIVSVALAAPSLAASGVVLHGDVKVVKSATIDGKSVEKLETPDRVVPGDQLLFVTEYRNETGGVVDNFVVTNPLPDAVQLSKVGDFEVSVDSGTTFAVLSQLKVRTEAGERAATLGDVTHVRWTLVRLEPGAAGTLKYEAVVR